MKQSQLPALRRRITRRGFGQLGAAVVSALAVGTGSVHLVASEWPADELVTLRSEVAVAQDGIHAAVYMTNITDGELSFDASLLSYDAELRLPTGQRLGIEGMPIDGVPERALWVRSMPGVWHPAPRGVELYIGEFLLIWPSEAVAVTGQTASLTGQSHVTLSNGESRDFTYAPVDFVIPPLI